MKGTPRVATVTRGNASERGQLRVMLEPGRLYVIDRGYAEYALFQEIVDGRSSFVARVRANAVWQEIEQRRLRRNWRPMSSRSKNTRTHRHGHCAL